MDRDDGWFERLYKKYYPGVVADFVRKGFTPEEARDLAQDVFVRVYKHMDTYRGDASERTWLFRIVHNVWANEIRSRGADMRKGHTISLDGGPAQNSEAGALEGLASPDLSPEARLEASELRQRLLAAIEGLPSRQRAVLLLQNRGYSYKEIAAILGITVETVKSLRHDALQTLKRTLNGTRLHLDESNQEEDAP